MTLMKPKIGIVSFSNDLHALVIEKLLSEQWGAECYYIEFDKLSGTNSITWSLEETSVADGWLNSRNGDIQVSKLDLIWWRRTTLQQAHSDKFADEAIVDLINKDTRDSLIGSLLTVFNGKWVSHPYCTQEAANKLHQLNAASQCGFCVPKTLVTQSIQELQQFYKRLDGRVIVKPVNGTNKQILYTRRLKPEELNEKESIECAPMMYQECIEGIEHYRINVFGDSVFAFRIESNDLDWRGNLDRPIEIVNLPESVQENVILTLRFLKLEMGVVDVKRDRNGYYYWFEVNPQGQFLFLEGLTGFDLKNEFCKFLVETARQKQQTTPNKRLHAERI